MLWKNGCLAGFTTALIPALVVFAQAAAADQDEAVGYFTAGKYVEAAEEFQAVIDEYPDYAYGYFMLGNCYLKLGRPEHAEKNLIRAIELDGDEFEYHYQLANTYVKLGKNDKVVSTLNDAEPLAANAKYRTVLYKLRGFAYFRDRNWQEAAADLARGGDDVEVVLRRTIARTYLGDDRAVEQALKASARAVKSSPDDGASRRLRAEILLFSAREADSDNRKTEAYRNALIQAEAFRQLEPDSVDADDLVGRAALGAQQYDQAVAAFTAALRKQPDRCSAMINQGKALISKEDWSGSQQSFDHATRCDPGSAMAWENKAYTLQKQEKFEEAAESYEKALSLNPNSVFAAGNLEICREKIAIRQQMLLRILGIVRLEPPAGLELPALGKL